MPSFTSAPPMNFMAALKRKRSDTSTVITRPVHTIFPLANSKVSLLWTAEPSAADCFPDAAEVLVDVDEQAVDDHLLGGHRGQALHQRTARRKLRVAQTTDRRGGGGAALPVQLDRLRAGAVSEVLRVPGIHLVEQLQAEIARSLPRRDGLDHGGDRLQHAGQVVGGHPHRPLLGLRHLLPVRVAELLQWPSLPEPSPRTAWRAPHSLLPWQPPIAGVPLRPPTPFAPALSRNRRRPSCPCSCPGAW